jgi:hypothetical protein
MSIRVKLADSDLEFEVPRHYIGHPVFGIGLIPVEEEVKTAPDKETPQIKEQSAPVTTNKTKE